MKVHLFCGTLPREERGSFGSFIDVKQVVSPLVGLLVLRGSEMFRVVDRENVIQFDFKVTVGVIIWRLIVQTKIHKSTDSSWCLTSRFFPSNVVKVYSAKTFPSIPIPGISQTVSCPVMNFHRFRSKRPHMVRAC